MQEIRLFLLIQAASFLAAAMVHFGVLLEGHEHRQAGVAETLIAVVLLIGLTLSLIRPGWTRIAGLVTQGFALLGTLVGIFTIIVGIGPRTVPDIIYHLAITAVLVWGLVVGQANAILKDRCRERRSSLPGRLPESGSTPPPRSLRWGRASW